MYTVYRQAHVGQTQDGCAKTGSTHAPAACSQNNTNRALRWVVDRRTASHLVLQSGVQENGDDIDNARENGRRCAVQNQSGTGSKGSIAPGFASQTQRPKSHSCLLMLVGSRTDTVDSAVT